MKASTLVSAAVAAILVLTLPAVMAADPTSTMIEGFFGDVDAGMCAKRKRVVFELAVSGGRDVGD